MKRKFSLISIALSLGLLAGISIYTISKYAFSDSSLHQEQEIDVETSILKTFDLDESKEIKAYSMDDIWGKNVKELSSEANERILSAYAMLIKDNEVKTGDRKALFFLKGDATLLIGIKHGDGTISLTEFDISTDKPAKIKTQTKEES